MEVKKKKFHPFRDLSLKWSFTLYAVVGILIALFLSLGLYALFEKLQSDISYRYESIYEGDRAREAKMVSADGEVLNSSIIYYTEPLRDYFTERDSSLYDLYGILAFINVPFVWIICVAAVGIIFYRRKLKRPLEALDAASARIGAGDLNFHVDQPSKNELGRLALSFETMREALLETNREMWRMAEGRKRLNAAFAHDLRTPLTVLRGYCDLLLTYTPEGKISEEKSIETLSTMNVYLKRLEGYTATMSSLQKLEEISLSPKETEFENICVEIESAAAIISAGKELNFHTEGTGNVNADTSVILRICENLIQNAVRYANSKVSVKCKLTEGLITVNVSDDGPGFTAEALRSAVLPYFRDDKNIADSSHFGIGLYVCKLLCEKHNGELNISNNGGGNVTAVFNINFL